MIGATRGTLGTEPRKYFLTGDQPYLAAFQVVAAAIKSLLCVSQFVKQTNNFVTYSN